MQPFCERYTTKKLAKNSIGKCLILKSRAGWGHPLPTFRRPCFEKSDPFIPAVVEALFQPSVGAPIVQPTWTGLRFYCVWVTFPTPQLHRLLRLLLVVREPTTVPVVVFTALGLWRHSRVATESNKRQRRGTAGAGEQEQSAATRGQGEVKHLTVFVSLFVIELKSCCW